MIIRVAEIPDEGLHIEGSGAFPHPFQDRAWALQDLDLTVEKDGEAILVTGTLAARVPQHCGRCLEPYAVTVRPDVQARFVPNPRGRNEELELGADDLETDVYDNGVIDLTSLLDFSDLSQTPPPGTPGALPSGPGPGLHFPIGSIRRQVLG